MILKTYECEMYKIGTPLPIDWYSINVYRITAGVSLVTVVALGVIMGRVIKISRCNEPIILLMLFFLQASLVFTALFFHTAIDSLKYNMCLDHSYYCQMGVYQTLPGICLCIALVLNLNKWTNFNLSVRAIVLEQR